VRLIVLQSCCAEAARVLVRALGSENEVRRAVGGVRWRQVRPGDGECVAFLYLLVGVLMGACASLTGSMRNGLWIRGTGRRQSAARRLLLPERRCRRPARVQVLSRRQLRRQVRTRRLVRVVLRQTRTLPRWMSCSVYCGHTEIWTRTRSVPVLLGAYCVHFMQGGYYFGSVDQERYSTIAMRFACSSHGPENAGIWSSVTCARYMDAFLVRWF
jgi:hypothetical protein